MRSAGDRLSLDDFLVEIAPRIDGDIGARLTNVHGIADHLLAHLGGHPELAAQIRKLRACLPTDLATAPGRDRAKATGEAEQLMTDIKQRWIEASDPPLVGEIDDRLEEVLKALGEIRRPGIEALRDAALRIERLARTGNALEGIEQRFLPWAIVGGVLFVIGLILFAAPGLLDGIPLLASPWTIVACLGVLPGLGIYYARKVLPRTQADTETDRLNREHFLPNGGLYFAQGEREACVVLVNWPPPSNPRAQAQDERRKTREKFGPLW